MPWDDDLLPKQREAAGYAGSHARLLAGPGTGKTLTLTRHACYLAEERSVPADKILAVTFTRAAARELHQRLEAQLGEGNCPRVSTLHSFALRQLLRNSNRLLDLPQPLRIADDWEERNIVLEDLKTLLKLGRIDDARDLLNQLSADWQSLTADEGDWETRFPNPSFLGSWREHRQIYGYTLRAELVYQLKKALEQRGDFELEDDFGHLLIDEYQDLNRCDLAVVQHIASRDVELFIAGDDDQSIYGFRKAHPQGIRRFPEDYPGAQNLPLEVCKRCDRGILNLGLFVARQDPRRIEKTIEPEPGRGEGEVAIVRFPNQDVEASGIAIICYHLLYHHGLRPDDILILLRSDRHGAFSTPLREALRGADIQVAAGTEDANPLNQPHGRALLAFLRLATNQEDHLAWRTLLEVWCPGVGPGAVSGLYDIARCSGTGFAHTVLAAHAEPSVLPTIHRNRLTRAIYSILGQLHSLLPRGISDEHETYADLMQVCRSAAEVIVADPLERDSLLNEFAKAAEAFNATSVEKLLRATEVTSEDIEQELEEGKVNILTMHKAKGLTAEAVIVVAAEDEYIPGRAVGDDIDDERRLLYVSLTRAKHHLFVTYCDRRTGRQRHTGRDGGRTARSLTRFLRDGPLTPHDGQTFINNLANEPT